MALGELRQRLHATLPPDSFAPLLSAGMNSDDILATLTNVLIATVHPLEAQLASALSAVLADAEIFLPQRSTAEGLDAIVDEILRFDPAFPFVARRTLAEVSMASLTIPRDASCLLFVASANRDPSVFERPSVRFSDQSFRPLGRSFD